MLENMGIGEIKHYMKKHSLGIAKLALEINVQAIRISEILKNKRRITADTDLRLCRLFKLNNGHFLKHQVEYDLKLAKENLRETIKEIKPL